MTTTSERAATGVSEAQELNAAIKTVATSGEPTIADIQLVLHLLGRIESDAIAETSDPKLRQPLALGRYQALCWFLSRKLTESFDSYTRHAPPSAIKDLVEDSLTTCAAHPDNGCVESVTPWDGPVTCGSVDCADTYARMVGEHS